MKHIPYENGGGTGEKKYKKIDHFYSFADHKTMKRERYFILEDCRLVEERPEDPIEEVIQETEEAWENNDLYIMGDRVDNQGKD